MKRGLEIGVGGFVLAGIVALFFLALKASNLGTLDGGGGYELVAWFENVGGLKVRAPVTVSGVRVGRVAAIDYDRERLQARVNLRIEDGYRVFPEDTSANIYTAGLLGEQYIALDPGGEDRMLGDGGRITITQSALVLEQLIGQFLFSKAAEGPEKKDQTTE